MDVYLSHTNKQTCLNNKHIQKLNQLEFGIDLTENIYF